jgi:hypothetical protein
MVDEPDAISETKPTVYWLNPSTCRLVNRARVHALAPSYIWQYYTLPHGPASALENTRVDRLIPIVHAGSGWLSKIRRHFLFPPWSVFSAALYRRLLPGKWPGSGVQVSQAIRIGILIFLHQIGLLGIQPRGHKLIHASPPSS